MKKLLICMLLVLIPLISFGSEYGQKVTEKAIEYTYVREKTNNNDGIEVERWLKNVGLSKGDPYCQSFVYSMFLETQPIMKGTMPMKTGRVSFNWEYAKKNPFKFKILTTNQIKLGIYTLRAGDIPVWSTSTDSITNFSGHTGLTIKQITNIYFKSIEGNTMPTSDGDQREGGGVFIRTRTIEPSYKFKLKGFIRTL